MLPPIPPEIYRLYDGLDPRERWHVKLRWRLCPFLQIAGFIPEAGRIVDIGCGRGMLANYLALTGPGRRVTGIDKQERRIKTAQATIEGRENIEFRFQDARDLQSEEFDVIIISDMLHHLVYPDQEKLLRHSFEVLPPGGLLLLEDVGRRPAWKWIAHYLIDRSLNCGRKQHFRREEEWSGLLERLGFSVESYPAHKGIPLSDFILRCKKNDQG